MTESVALNTLGLYVGRVGSAGQVLPQTEIKVCLPALCWHACMLYGFGLDHHGWFDQCLVNCMSKDSGSEGRFPRREEAVG